MNSIKIQDYWSAENQIKRSEKINKRILFIEQLVTSVPYNSKFVSGWVDSIGDMCFRFFIEIGQVWESTDDELTLGKWIPVENIEEETIRAKSFAQSIIQDVTPSKGMRESGKIYYTYSKKMQDDFGEYDFVIIIENGSPLTCKIEQEEVMTTKFKIHCEEV